MGVTPHILLPGTGASSQAGQGRQRRRRHFGRLKSKHPASELGFEGGPPKDGKASLRWLSGEISRGEVGCRHRDQKPEGNADFAIALSRLEGRICALASKRERAAIAGRVVQRRTIGAPCRGARGPSPNRQPEGTNRLLARLDQNEDILRTFNRATLAVNPSRRITPAAEWLLDNFYLIEEQIQMARRHLPRGYSRELPRLSNGLSAGLPRVYDIVLELISHVDAQIDAEPLSAFVAAYQTVVP